MLKSQKGITLTSLVIYMIIFGLIIGVMTTISTFFYTGIGEVVDTPKYLAEFNKFSMFFVADIKNYNSATVTENTIQFEDGPTYKYDGAYIYRNNVPICKYIMNCTFTAKTYNVNTTTKNLINVDMQVGKNENKSITKNADFKIKKK